MRDVKQAMQTALNAASWSRFVSVLFVAVICFGYKSVDSWPSLGRLLVAAAAVVAFAFCSELLAEFVLNRKPGSKTHPRRRARR